MTFQQEDEATALRPPVAMGLTARARQRRDAGSGQRNIGKAGGCLEREDAVLVVGTTRGSFAFGTLVEVAGLHKRTQLEAQTRINNSMQTDRRLEHSLLTWTLATVK